MRRYFCLADLLAALGFGNDGVRWVVQVCFNPTRLLTEMLILNQSTNILDLLLKVKLLSGKASIGVELFLYEDSV